MSFQQSATKYLKIVLRGHAQQQLGVCLCLWQLLCKVGNVGNTLAVHPLTCHVIQVPTEASHDVKKNHLRLSLPEHTSSGDSAPADFGQASLEGSAKSRRLQADRYLRGNASMYEGSQYSPHLPFRGATKDGANGDRNLCYTVQQLQCQGGWIGNVHARSEEEAITETGSSF